MSYALLNISNLLFILSLIVLDIWGLESDISYINLVKILESLGINELVFGVRMERIPLEIDISSVRRQTLKDHKV